MKKILLLFTCCYLTLMMSCKDNEATNNTSSEVLAGIWTLTAVNVTGYNSLEITGEDIISTSFTGTGLQMNLQILFDENPNEFSTIGDYSLSVDLIIEGVNEQTEWINRDFMSPGIWNKSNDSLNITLLNGDTQSANIIQSDNNTLILEWESQTTTIETNSTFTQNEMGTYTFEKQ